MSFPGRLVGKLRPWAAEPSTLEGNTLGQIQTGDRWFRDWNHTERDLDLDACPMRRDAGKAEVHQHWRANMIRSATGSARILAVLALCGGCGGGTTRRSEPDAYSPVVDAAVGGGIDRAGGIAATGGNAAGESLATGGSVQTGGSHTGGAGGGGGAAQTGGTVATGGVGDRGGSSTGGSRGGTNGYGGCTGCMTSAPNNCTAGSETFPSGSTNPQNPCQTCGGSASSKYEWQPVLDIQRVSCGAGGLCQAGKCAQGCTIDGTIYPSGAGNPAKPCEQTCQPSQSKTAWSNVPPAHCVTAISAGGRSTCVLAEGKAFCWGAGYDGTKTTTPTVVAGLPAGVTAISVGRGSHTCALVAGVAYCWGSNRYGALGDGTTKESYVPVRVTGLEGKVQAISAGEESTCAVVEGAVYCWGRDSILQLGNQDGPSPTPVRVSTLVGDAQDVAVGAGSACALVAGGAYCWGANQYGQLGMGSPDDGKVPVQAPMLASGVQSVSIGSHNACAVVAGAAWCWGVDWKGELGGVTSGATVYEPQMVSKMSSGVTSISVGGSHVCALKDGGAWCWGDTMQGALGIGLASKSGVMQVQGLSSGVRAISAGYEHTCAVAVDGIWCWGDGIRSPMPVPFP